MAKFNPANRRASPLAGLIAQRPFTPQSPIKLGQSRPIYLSDNFIGEGKCLEVGNGKAHLVGFASEDQERVWETRVSVLEIMPRRDSGYNIPEDANLTYHPRGVSGYNLLSRQLR